MPYSSMTKVTRLAKRPASTSYFLAALPSGIREQVPLVLGELRLVDHVVQADHLHAQLRQLCRCVPQRTDLGRSPGRSGLGQRSALPSRPGTTPRWSDRIGRNVAAVLRRGSGDRREQLPHPQLDRERLQPGSGSNQPRRFPRQHGNDRQRPDVGARLDCHGAGTERWAWLVDRAVTVPHPLAPGALLSDGVDGGSGGVDPRKARSTWASPVPRRRRVALPAASIGFASVHELRRCPTERSSASCFFLPGSEDQR